LEKPNYYNGLMAALLSEMGVEIRVVERIDLPYENIMRIHIRLEPLVAFQYEYHYEDGKWLRSTGVHESLEPILENAIEVFLKSKGFGTLEDLSDHMMDTGSAHLEKN
jgi:hypothetical protein